MRLFNITSVYILASLASCSSGKDTTTVDGDADTDTDTDADIETADTAPDGPSGPWVAGYIAYSAYFGVDDTGAFTSVVDYYGDTLQPTLIVNLLSTDFFGAAGVDPAHEDEFCAVVIDMSNATSVPVTGTNYVTYSFDALESTYTDECAGIAELNGYPGYSPALLWSALQYTVSVGPYDNAMWDAYNTPGYGTDHIGGIVTDSAFILATSKDTPFPWSLYGQAYPFTGATYDYYAPLAAAAVPNGTGITSAFYYLSTGGLYSGLP
jgi:hypothetical protein